MQHTLKHLLLLLCVFCLVHARAQQAPATQPYLGYFKIQYVFVGLGSNMYELQPMFDVENKNFTYTFGDVWLTPGEEKPKPDTVITGTLRQSSIDSIVALLPPCRDTTIKKINTRVMSGGLDCLDIFTDDKSVCFYLDNSYHIIAAKIVAILNTYVPPACQQLIIPNWDEKKPSVENKK